MPTFSVGSLKKLETCHQLLQQIAHEAVKKYNCTVVSGRRGEKEQNELHAKGYSRLKFPNSKHNGQISMAIDLAPYVKGKGVVWDHKQCYDFAGYVKRIAEEMNIKIRRGADWDSDGDVTDQRFFDPCHFELVDFELVE